MRITSAISKAPAAEVALIAVVAGEGEAAVKVYERASTGCGGMFREQGTKVTLRVSVCNMIINILYRCNCHGENNVK